MKRRHDISTIVQLAVVAIAVLFSSAPLKGQQLPPPSQVTTNSDLGFCALSQTTFNSWFVNGSPSLNGAVNPANSAQFDGSTFCNFYQWGQQMFLWVTSPAAPIYGGSGRVFDSPIFFDVTPPDKNGTRHLIPHVQGFVHNLALRVTELGPSDFPIAVSTQGQLLEIHPTPVGPHRKPLVLSQAGAKVEAQLSVENGKLVAKDKAGKEIPNAKPLPMKQVGRVLAVEEFNINGKPVFVDQFGNVINTEEGQATGDALMGQPNRSLIYYVTMVNDVWAYWHQKYPAVTPPNGNAPPPNSNVSFPTSQTGIPTMPDCNAQSCALAIELKTSWIDVTGLRNVQNYITMKATVPTYNMSSNRIWTPTGGPPTTKTLALVGIHVIGSTKGHPEMIWASFEPFGNTPDGTGPAPYQYYNASGNPTPAPTPVPGAKWVFSSSSSPNPFNVSHMSVATPPCGLGSPSGSICAQPSQTISPSDTVRTAPFGMPNGTFTNNATNGTTKISTNNIVSNTQVISANNGVLTQMPTGDVRNNYYLLGAIWTIGGVPLCTINNGNLSCVNDCVSATPQSPTNQVGTCMLENSTMETYAQLSPNWQNPPQNAFQSSCFDCHQAAATTSGITSTDVSHIYSATWPLPSLEKIVGKTKASKKK